MEYEFELTVPAATAKASPATVECQLTKGIIHRYDFGFLEGCNNLVSVAAFEGGFQCFPINRDGAIRGNAETVGKDTFYPLEARPFKLTVKGWAPNTTYEHTVQIRLDVLPRAYFEKSQEIQQVIDAVTKELQREYVETAGAIADRLELVARQITPREPEEPEEPAGESEKTGLDQVSILDKVSQIDLAILQAQIRQGWSNDRIIAANASNGRLDPGELPEILKALRETMGGTNG